MKASDMCDMTSEHKALSKYRLEKAKEDICTSERNYDAGDYRAANNRAYYAIFHSLRAVLALDEYDSKKHSGIISEFRKRYIKSGIFDAEISKMIDKAFEIRNVSDYDDMFIASKNETERQIQNAKYVTEKIETYLSSMEG